jgi:hypothetical protein
MVGQSPGSWKIVDEVEEVFRSVFGATVKSAFPSTPSMFILTHQVGQNAPILIAIIHADRLSLLLGNYEWMDEVNAQNLRNKLETIASAKRVTSAKRQNGTLTYFVVEGAQSKLSFQYIGEEAIDDVGIENWVADLAVP